MHKAAQKEHHAEARRNRIYAKLKAARDPKYLRVAENVFEDIGETAATAAEATASTHAAIFKSSMAELIVSRTLLRITQRFVGFVDFLELLFRLAIARVAVRMVPHGEFAKGAFKFLLVGVSRHAERLVKICLHQ